MAADPGHSSKTKPSMACIAEVRFNSKVKDTGPVTFGMEECCYIWTGSFDAAGYPKFWLNGNSTTAQRAAIIIGGTALSSGQSVISICGNRSCVRRSHLVVGKLSDAHMLSYRGQTPVGAGDIAFMRTMVATGEASLNDLVGQYGLSMGVLEGIILL
jgi:hypothetical protein